MEEKNFSKSKKIIICVICVAIVAGVIALGVLNKDKLLKNSKNNNVTRNIATVENNSNETNITDVFSKFVTKKYSGESTQADSNKENPSWITNYYTLTFISDNNCALEIKTLYKAKENTIKINSINITNSDIAAGTSYIEFTFTGSDDNEKKYDGSGTISYSNILNDNKIGLELIVNQNIFDGINVSTEFMNLVLNNN